MSAITIERAVSDDLPQVLDLLGRQFLPLDGLADHAATTVVARQDGRVVGSAAIELYEDGGLLRSVAVDDHLKGQGLGRALTERAIELARDAGLDTLYLLTTTAEGYFPKLGFEPAARDEVPAGVRSSVEFTSACPASAVVMRKRLS
jgi:amino-acid N-acetyltransferase